MKRASSVAWILLLGTIAFAQNASLTGTWELDTKPSDFGSEPAPKSTSSTVKDTPKMFSFRGHGIDDKGKSFSYSWSGPTDGSMHPTTENGKVTGQSSIRKVGDGFVRHGEGTDGSSFDAKATVSSDGDTITVESSAKSKDGKETKQKSVFHRVSTQTSPGKKPA